MFATFHGLWLPKGYEPHTFENAQDQRIIIVQYGGHLPEIDQVDICGQIVSVEEKWHEKQRD